MKSMPVCKFFLAGRCNVGQLCRFSHAPPTEDGYPNGNGYPHDPSFIKPIPKNFRTVPCRNYPLGTCTFGDKCSFIHTSSGALSPHHHHEQQQQQQYPSYPPTLPNGHSIPLSKSSPTPRPLPPPTQSPLHTTDPNLGWSVPLSSLLLTNNTTPPPKSPDPHLHNTDWSHTPSPLPPVFPTLHPLPPPTSNSVVNGAQTTQAEEEHEDESYEYENVPGLGFVLDENESSMAGLRISVPRTAPPPAPPIASRAPANGVPAIPTLPNGIVTPYPQYDMFRVPPPPPSAYNAFSSPQPNMNYRTKPCRFYAQYGQCPKGEDCTFMHDPASQPITLPKHPLYRTRECKFHLQGLCRQGSECPFKHTGSAGAGLDEEERAKREGMGSRPCKWFALGSCLRGDKCLYLHDAAVVAAQVNATKDIPCRFYKGPGTCRSGEECKWSHSFYHDRQLNGDDGELNVDVEDPEDSDDDEVIFEGDHGTQPYTASIVAINGVNRAES